MVVAPVERVVLHSWCSVIEIASQADRVDEREEKKHLQEVGSACSEVVADYDALAFRIAVHGNGK